MQSPQRPLRVLVVDDCPDTLASYSELLRLHGHDVRVARRAERALALLGLLDGWEPDVALIDLCMPGVDGYELARQFRERPDPRAAPFTWTIRERRDSEPERASFASVPPLAAAEHLNAAVPLAGRG